MEKSRFLLLGAQAGGVHNSQESKEGKTTESDRPTLPPPDWAHRYLVLQNENIATVSINSQQVLNMKSAK